MARPKSTRPRKQNLKLTVTQETRLMLTALSQHTGDSISQLLEDYAQKEYKKLKRQQAKEQRGLLRPFAQMPISELDRVEWFAKMDAT